MRGSVTCLNARELFWLHEERGALQEYMKELPNSVSCTAARRCVAVWRTGVHWRRGGELVVVVWWGLLVIECSGAFEKGIV